MMKFVEVERKVERKKANKWVEVTPIDLLSHVKSFYSALGSNTVKFLVSSFIVFSPKGFSTCVVYLWTL